MATMNKEEKNNYVIHVPHWLWRFVPHCFITPQHILKKPGKKTAKSSMCRTNMTGTQYPSTQ
jgi:hypothetical protein